MAKYKIEMVRWGVADRKYYDSYDRAKADYDGLVKYAKWTHEFPILIKLIRVDPIDRVPIALLGVYRYDGVEFE